MFSFKEATKEPVHELHLGDFLVHQGMRNTVYTVGSVDDEKAILVELGTGYRYGDPATLDAHSNNLDWKDWRIMDDVELREL